MALDASEVPPPPATAPAAARAQTPLKRLAGWARNLELFTQRPPAPVTARKVAMAVVAVLLGTAASLARTRGPGALNSIWAEDGHDFLADAVNKTVVGAFKHPFNGYWHFGPRLLAEIASWFPIEWAPGVMSTEAALVTTVLGLIVYLASGAYFDHPALRLLAAVPVALAPAGVGWVENNVATLQFPLLYGLFWALLWVPSNWWGRLTAVGVVVFTAFSTPLAVLFVPLALVRLVIRRDLLGWALAAALASGVAMQYGGMASRGASRAGVGIPRYDPVWAVGEYLTKVVPTAIFGEKWTFDRMEQGVCPAFVVSHPQEHWILVAGSWLIGLALVFVAVRRGRPAVALATVAMAYSVALYSASIMTLGCSANRYFVAPALLVLTAIAALLRPRASHGSGDGTRARLAPTAVVFLTLAAVVCVANLRSDSPRSTSPAWSGLVRTARQQCLTEHSSYILITTTVPNWTMTLRCSALTG